MESKGGQEADRIGRRPLGKVVGDKVVAHEDKGGDGGGLDRDGDGLGLGWVHLGLWVGIA